LNFDLTSFSFVLTQKKEKVKPACSDAGRAVSFS